MRDESTIDTDAVAFAALADTTLFDRFARIYRGPHDPADALWWLAHPLEAGPSGAPSPSALLRAERRALYRRGTVDDGAADRLRALQRELDSDAAECRRAAREALTASSPRMRRPASVRPARRLLAVAAVAALAGGVIGWAAAQRPAIAAPSVRLAALRTAVAPLPMLDRPPRVDDAPPVLLDPAIDGSSVRLLLSDQEAGVELFAGRIKSPSFKLRISRPAPFAF